MTLRSPTGLLGAVAAAAALVVAGCGNTGTSVAPPQLTSFNLVAKASSDTDTGRFDLKLGLSVPGVESSFGFSASGGFDTPARRAQLTFDMSALAKLLKGLGSSFGATRGTIPSDPGAWKLDVIQDGTTVYVRLPAIADQLPAGKTWVKGDASELSSAAAGRLGQFGSFAGADPRDIFGYLKAVSGKIDAVGSEQIRGVETSHYRAAIDVRKLEQLVPPEQRAGLGSIDQAFTQAGLSAIPIDVWIDAERRLRKLVMDVTATAPGAGGTGSARLELEVYDYGVPLELALPPADQVVDASTLTTR